MPGRVYSPTRQLYDALIAAIPGARGSGILAAKSGYHSSRSYNQRRFPGNYSIRNAPDLRGPSDGAAAVDVTMSTANMKLYTKRVMDALDRNDPRVRAVKEIIGTLDGRTVIRYTRTHPGGSLTRASSDSSHLWHQHYSLFRESVNDWDSLKGIVEVVTGRPVGTPTPAPAAPKAPAPKPAPVAPKAPAKPSVSGLPTVRRGSKGMSVQIVQALLAQRGHAPANSFAANGRADGVAGPGTDAAIRAYQRSAKIGVDGIVGPVTWGKLLGALPTVRKGSKGVGVRIVQALLAQRGHAPANSFQRNGRADGIAGNGTDTAIRNFQRSRKIGVDGIVGPVTYNRLLRG